MKMNMFLVAVVAVAFMAAVQNVAAVHEAAPAPSPISDATTFLPAVFASVSALAFGLLF
ncbi:hypothetical protein ABFS82_11G001100 [Erythranthe guttata]|uniref:arabinogalactan peptide 12-like n=1 Tax=Erythranthe guttata TaxID=4155 RepID=UPI00064DE4CD|nr:PREDICTED: arabinogalactan peptide 12-like [Erythranthe guttata]|eukprot:XP_012857329.1 PREDICTED: arabinogalactan peptide 12-like [Erythranthe guttata]